MKFVSFIDYNKCISFFSKIRPHWLKRKIFSKMLALLFYIIRLRSILHQIRLTVYTVSGVKKQTGDVVRLLFVGNDEFPVFLSDRIFKENATVKPCERVFCWRIKDIEKRYNHSVDAVIVTCDRLYRRFLQMGNMLVFPVRIEMVLDTSKSVEFLLDKRYISHSAYTDIKKVKNGNYTFEITDDIEKIQMFYQSMFLPMVHHRHTNNLEYIPPFIFFSYLREVGYKLFLVNDQNGNPVSGVYFLENQKEMFNRYAGILHGDNRLLQYGATAARYYFSILYAKEKGVETFNFGATMPFFHNGIFKYKKKWGMNVVKTRRTFFPQVIGMHIYPNCKSLRHFLLNNPFIGLSQDDQFVAYVFTDKETCTEKERKQVENQYKKSGIDEVQLIKV